MNHDDIKLAIEILTLGFAVLGGLVALTQWRRDQAWKRAEKLDALYRDFEGSRLIQIACKVLDWSRGKFKFQDGEEFRFDEADVLKSLALHGDQELTFTPTQARMRDAYDSMLSFFERLETAIQNGLVDEKSAVRLFGYWVDHFVSMTEHPESADAAAKYIGRYANIISFSSLAHRGTGK
jgi:hypothetical protein